MKQDRFLWGILVFIVLLVIAALALFFIRQSTPVVYGSEDTPQGVIWNYALALHNRDYARAYAYLAENDYKPGYEYFRQAFLNRQLDITGTAIQIGETEIFDENEATIQVTILYQPSGPFSEGWNSTENASLIRQEGAWRITNMPHPYWYWDWYQQAPEPYKP